MARRVVHDACILGNGHESGPEVLAHSYRSSECDSILVGIIVSMSRTCFDVSISTAFEGFCVG